MDIFRNVRDNGVLKVANSATRLALLPSDGDLVEQLDDNSLWAWHAATATWVEISATTSGTVTSVSIVSANGLAGTVATATTTPAITLSTTVTGILSGNGTAISAASTTGSGAVVLATSPTLVTPALGTPSALVGTNITGTAAGLTAGNVTTNANLTGVVTSVGNATSIADGALTLSKTQGQVSNNGVIFEANSGLLTSDSDLYYDPILLTLYASSVASGSFTGPLNGTATNANNVITNPNNNNATYYPTFVLTPTTGAGNAVLVNTSLSYNPSTHVLQTTTFAGALTGTATGNTTYTANNHGIVISSATNAMTVLAPNASTAFPLVSGGTGANPSWALLSIAGGGTGQSTANAAFNALSPMTTGGDLTYGGASGAGTRLANGSSGQVLTSAGGTSAPTWSTPPYASTDIASTTWVGPANNTANQTITGLTFSTSILSFEALVNIAITASSNTWTTIKLIGTRQATSDWSTNSITTEIIGDPIVGLAFNITSAGQVQITTGTTAGYSSASTKFRAITL